MRDEYVRLVENVNVQREEELTQRLLDLGFEQTDVETNSGITNAFHNENHDLYILFNSDGTFDVFNGEKTIESYGIDLNGLYAFIDNSEAMLKEDESEDKKAAIVADVEEKRSKGELGYIPGLTAISRREGAVSTIGKVLSKVVEPGSKILHAGAGRPNNPDRKLIDDLSSGNAVHYDPGQETSNDRSAIGHGDFDVVVSPFVLNVLNKEDRMMPIRDMLKSLKDDGYAIVGVRGDKDVGGSRVKPNWIEWSDGYLVPKGKNVTFQKGFSAEELKAQLEPFFNKVEILVRKGTAPVVKATGPKSI